MLTASQIGTAARRFQAAYAVVMAPLSRELDMAPSALDILLYLANNPGRDTARDICAYRHLKPGIVSLHVERLVAEGYLTRSPVPGDRRKCRLLCTEKAWPVIRRGRQYQAHRPIDGGPVPRGPGRLPALSRGAGREPHGPLPGPAGKGE